MPSQNSDTRKMSTDELQKEVSAINEKMQEQIEAWMPVSDFMALCAEGEVGPACYFCNDCAHYFPYDIDPTQGAGFCIVLRDYVYGDENAEECEDFEP